MTDTAKRGRPAQFRNVAEKQKAYRERQKVEKQSVELGLALLEDAKESEVTLRKSLDYWTKKGVSIEARHNKGMIYESCDWYKGGQFGSQIDPILFKHLVRKGALIFREKTWQGSVYDFCLEKMEKVS